MSEIGSPTADTPRFTRGHHRGHRQITQIWFNIGGGNVEPMLSLRATPSRSRLTGISDMLETRPSHPPYPSSAANRLLRSTTTDSASIGAPRPFGCEGRSHQKLRSRKTGPCGQKAMPSRCRCTDPSCAKLIENIKRDMLPLIRYSDVIWRYGRE